MMEGATNRYRPELAGCKSEAALSPEKPQFWEFHSGYHRTFTATGISIISLEKSWNLFSNSRFKLEKYISPVYPTNAT